eukprot:972857-Pyramimonas_sp.AAC.1
MGQSVRGGGEFAERHSHAEDGAHKSDGGARERAGDLPEEHDQERQHAGETSEGVRQSAWGCEVIGAARQKVVALRGRRKAASCDSYLGSRDAHAPRSMCVPTHSVP